MLLCSMSQRLRVISAGSLQWAMSELLGKMLIPGLQREKAWPDGVRVQPAALSPEERRAKRSRILEDYKQHPDYQSMAFLRSNRAFYKTPGGQVPESPDTTPRHPRRRWQREFLKFKTLCQQWANWMRHGQAYNIDECQKKTLEHLILQQVRNQV